MSSKDVDIKKQIIKTEIPGTNDRRLYHIGVDVKNRLQECSSCHEIKDFDSFRLDKRRANYGNISHQCLECDLKEVSVYDTIICSCCKEEKLVIYFYKNKSRSTGYDLYCKSCRSIYSKNHYNPTLSKELRKKYRGQWLLFFNEYYGNSPECQVCCKSLEYFNKDKTLAVHWDHRYGEDKLTFRGPGSWIVGRPCIEKHQEAWLVFDYGILCHQCNINLPTVNREQWLQQVQNYVYPNNELWAHEDAIADFGY